MIERKITINGTNQQVTLTAEEVGRFRFLAVDMDGEVWLYDNKPHIEAPDQGYWSPADALFDYESLDSGEVIDGASEIWSDSLTPINVVLDPVAMATAVRSLIAGRLMERSDNPDFKKLLEEVTALIEAGN